MGLLLGWAAGRRTSVAEKKYREITLKLEQVTQEKLTFEAEVAEHFTKTADLLNNLTESYREVHNHLAQGAATLCQGEGPMSLTRPEEDRDPTEIPRILVDPRPPLDYAPKLSPDEKGMLNEEFGLERRSLPVAAEKWSEV
ncbi:MAG TPA: DUF1043 family protein [Halioglobus sp.]